MSFLTYNNRNLSARSPGTRTEVDNRNTESRISYVPTEADTCRPEASHTTLLPYLWEEILSQTPSQSEADDSSTVSGETATEASIDEPLGPCEFVTCPISEDEAPYETSRNSVVVPFTKDFDCVVIAQDHSNRNARDGKIFKYLVSKDVLSVSSPVLKSLIKTTVPSCRAPSNGPDDGEIGELPKPRHTLRLEGSPSAFYIIFSIIHFIPDKKALLNIDFKIFTEIAVLVERYDWGQALQPWDRIWLKKFAQFALQPGYENWLYVAKIFNTTKNVEKLVARLGKQCCEFNETEVSRRYKGHDQWSRDIWNEKSLTTELWPSELKDQIMSSRETSIKNLAECLRILLDLFGAAGYFKCDEYLCDSDICRSLAYGSLLRSMKLNDLTPEIADGKWDGCVEELGDRLGRVTFVTLGTAVPEHKCVMKYLGQWFPRPLNETRIKITHQNFTRICSGGFVRSVGAN